ncbi:hypothetical protein NDU88_006760 [Pleurodeles waltl]|uniref:Uncharacterized protein n=1 Tax=Pleurodeles waltl TaxID=8319 RepID=A0AAV7NU87_PLEWA|nr:hypothetical protein NDU88_006760 [Pleurodeles waltl]
MCRRRGKGLDLSTKKEELVKALKGWEEAREPQAQAQLEEEVSSESGVEEDFESSPFETEGGDNSVDPRARSRHRFMASRAIAADPCTQDPGGLLERCALIAAAATTLGSPSASLSLDIGFKGRAL